MKFQSFKISSLIWCVAGSMTMACGKGHKSEVQSPAHSAAAQVAAADEDLAVAPAQSSPAQQVPGTPAPTAPITEVPPSPTPAEEVVPVPAPTPTPEDVTPQPENPAPVPSPLEEAKAQLAAADTVVSSILMELIDLGIESYPMVRQSLINALTTLSKDQASKQTFMKVYKADLQETQDSLDILRAKPALSESENELISQLSILLSSQKLKVETLDSQISSAQTLLDKLYTVVSYMETDRPQLLEIIKKLEAEQA